MKTKILFFFLLIFSISSWISISYASVQHVYLNNTGTTEWHYFCSVDTVIVHKPSIAMNSIYWDPPIGPNISGQDSVIVTSTNTGIWHFYSDEVDKYIYIFIISSPPVEPACMANDTSFCTSTFNLPLNAQNNLPGGHASTYLWSTGATTQTITVTTPGTYTVTITNACGVGVYDINVTQANPNAPHLGADQVFCWGSGSVLDPLSTNVASYQWSTGATTPTITVDTTGTYWVYLVDNNGCSGRDTVQVTTLVPIDAPICYVEFDTLTWKNNINWTINLPGNADSVRIYKEYGLNFLPIGTVSKTINHFLDIASTPQSQSYRYKIAVIDTCGNESELSSPHKTITLLSVYDQPSNIYTFNWSFYEGLVVSYYYLNGIDISNNVTQIAQVNWNIDMYNYISPNPAFVKYYIGFETPDCNAKTNVIVKSNWVIKDSLLTSVHEVGIIPFSIFPNPASDQVTLQIDATDFQVQLLTTLGQVVLSEYNVKTLDVSSLSKGLYIIQVTVAGTVSKQKIIIN